MAEAVGFASAVIGIAELGFKLTTSLYRFSKAYAGADRTLEGIANTISVTSAILTTLGDLVKDDPRDLEKLKRWATVPDTISLCRKDFERIEKALKAAKTDTKRAVVIAPASRNDEFWRPWQKM